MNCTQYLSNILIIVVSLNVLAVIVAWIVVHKLKTQFRPKEIKQTKHRKEVDRLLEMD
jgi:hypothetical protein